MRSPSSFLRISLAAFVALLVIAASFTETHSQGAATQPATMGGTMAATDGAYPPCPAAILAATPASTSAATVSASPSPTTGPTATATMTPSATMFVSTAQAPAAGCQLSTKNLTGAAEVPGPGAVIAGGNATLTITRPASGPGQICFVITVGGSDIKLPATGANLYWGAAKTNGPMVVSFSAPGVGGPAMGCVQNVDRTLIKQLLTHPDMFYVNILTNEFPNGAIRGQLGPVSSPSGQ